MYDKKSNLKILISSLRLVKKINKLLSNNSNYPDWIDTQYPDISIVFYGYEMCKKLGDLVYRHDILFWENPTTQKLNEEYCEICGEFVPGFKYIGCCSGFECGCMGQPIEPCICGTECWEVLYAK